MSTSNNKLLCLFLFIGCITGVALFLFNERAAFTRNPGTTFMANIQIAPWKGIGGCGAGGAGGGTGDGIRWIGYGVSGGIIDLQVLPKFNMGRNFHYFTVAPKFSYKPTYTTTADISIPIVSKTGATQIQSNQPEFNRTTGGLGDIQATFSKSFGLTGQYLLTLGLSFPTGQYDIKRVRDREPEFLPTELQNGTGLYNSSLTIERTVDVENGMWFFDVIYNHPFIVRPFSKQNEFLDTYFSDYKDRTGNRRFYYRGKPYGENDIGDYTPPSITLSTFFSYKNFEHHVHSLGLIFNAPLGVAWKHSPFSNVYDPAPDPDHKAWSGALIYGVEFSREKLPLFLSVSLPLHDKADPYGRWNAPDWSDFLNQWTFAFGFKTTFF
jgi:hypothetical protein